MLGFVATLQLFKTIVWFGNDNTSNEKRAEMGGTIAAPAFSYFYKNILKFILKFKENYKT